MGDLELWAIDTLIKNGGPESDLLQHKSGGSFNFMDLRLHQVLSEALQMEQVDESILERSELDEDIWRIVSRSQVLTEDFILRNHDKLDMFYISIKQKLSEGFIADNIDLLHLEGLKKNEELESESRLIVNRLEELHSKF